jgi:diacylglycerol kinase family enzyme
MLQTLFRRYNSFAATVGVDDKQLRIHNLLDVVIVKQPFYGYGLRMVPGARWDDGLLHMRFVSARVLSALGTLVTAAMVGNRVGPYLRGRHITVQLSRPCGLQTDGDVAWESDRFHFRVLPKAVKIKG